MLHDISSVQISLAIFGDAVDKAGRKQRTAPPYAVTIATPRTFVRSRTIANYRKFSTKHKGDPRRISAKSQY
jgi:hypothetical protein